MVCEVALDGGQFYLLVMLMIWFYFIYLAEEKKDAVYYLVSGVLGLPIGTLLLNLQGDILHRFFGIAVICIAGYLFFLFLAYAKDIRQK